MQGGGAAVERSQPEGQTAARRRRADRSDILLPPRVRLPTKTVAEEADALTKTCPPPSPRLRSPRRGPSPLRFFYTTVAIVALIILFIIMIIYYYYYYDYIITFVSIVFTLFLNYYFIVGTLKNDNTRYNIIISYLYDMYGQKTKFSLFCVCGARIKPFGRDRRPRD